MKVGYRDLVLSIKNQGLIKSDTLDCPRELNMWHFFVKAGFSELVFCGVGVGEGDLEC